MKNVIFIMLLISQISCVFDPCFLPAEGKVIDDSSKMELENVKVKLNRTSTKTNKNGLFNLTSDCSEDMFYLTAEGYNPFKLNYIHHDDTVTYRIPLDKSELMNGTLKIANSINFSVIVLEVGFTFNLSNKPIFFDNYSPSGKVIDFRTNLPIKDAIVSINSEIIKTDSLGRFKSKKRYSNSIQIAISSKGYFDFEMKSYLIYNKYLDYTVSYRMKEVSYNPPKTDSLRPGVTTYNETIPISSCAFSVSNIDDFVFKLNKIVE